MLKILAQTPLCVNSKETEIVSSSVGWERWKWSGAFVVSDAKFHEIGL